MILITIHNLGTRITAWQRNMIGYPRYLLSRPISIGALLSGLLGVVVLAALEVPDWLILLTDVPIPWLGHWVPYVAPLLVAILVFCLAVALVVRNYRLPILPGTLLFACFVMTLAGVSLFHWVRDGGAFADWLFTAYLWIFLFYLTLRGFDLIMLDTREVLVRWTVRWIIVVAVLQFLLANIISNGRGATLGFIATQHLFDSAYVAYLSVFGITLLLFETPRVTGRKRTLTYLVLLPFLIFIIYDQRLTGPLLILAALLALKLLERLPARIQLGAFVTGMVATVLLVGMLLMNAGGSTDPTLQGLHGGPYLFDEFGYIHGDLQSSYTRSESIRLQIRLFLTSPLWGVGMAEASKIKVIFLGMHSSLLYIMATAGLIGLGMMLLFWISVTRAAMFERGIGVLALPLIWLTMSLLTTEPVWWWSIIAFLIATTRPPRLTARDAPITNER